MIELYQKRNPVGILAPYHAQHPQGRGNRVTAPLDGQTNDVIRIEVNGVGGKGGTGGMLHPLIHRQQGQITGSGQTTNDTKLNGGKFDSRCNPGPIKGKEIALILTLNPNKEINQAVTVVPTLAPIITPTDSTSVSKPAFTKLTTITVVADDD